MTTDSYSNVLVAIIKSPDVTEAVIQELQVSGFDMNNLSIVGPDYHSDKYVVGQYNPTDRIRYWGTAGTFWGGIWGLFFGSSFILIPEMGPLIVTGPLVKHVVSILEGAISRNGLGVIGTGFMQLGIPKPSIQHYETALKAHCFVHIISGSTVKMTGAKTIFSRYAIGLPKVYPL